MAAFERENYVKNNKLLAAVLLVALVGPALILGFYVAPWFFLILVGLIVIPLLFVNRGAN